MTPIETLAHVRDELEQSFVERGDVIDGALVALLARPHVLLIGPPGTAKSMLADELCRRIEGAAYFQWLLTKFTTPEELFGAVSLKALEADEYRRVTTHKLPEAHIAFLDEVFKANSSILNAILTLMNERRFHNGRESSTVPLLTLFGATNELPEDDELAALYDRFLVRFVVGYVQRTSASCACFKPSRRRTRRCFRSPRSPSCSGEPPSCRFPPRCCATSPTCGASSGGSRSSPRIVAIGKRSACCARVLCSAAAPPSAKRTSRSSSTCCGATRRSRRRCAPRCARWCAATRTRCGSCSSRVASSATTRCAPGSRASSARAPCSRSRPSSATSSSASTRSSIPHARAGAPWGAPSRSARRSSPSSRRRLRSL